MKAKKIACCLLASALVVPCVMAITACGDKDGGTSKVTDFGNKTLTAEVKKPSKNVEIKLIRGKNVLDKDTNVLSYDKALQAGDIIEIESDYSFLKVKLFETLGEQIIYSPSGQFTFQIPSAASQAVYDGDTFKGSSHTFTASVATDDDVKSANRNLALNPYDYMYVDEKNDANAATLPETLLSSSAVADGQVTAYPHAYSNRVTRNEIGFYARNAIDGSTTSNGHGNFPYQSWGYNQKEDAEFVVYFGREVELDKVAFVLRADYSGTKEHDTYWESATVEFSDGSTQEVTLEKKGTKQEISLTQPVKTTSARIKNLNAVQSANSENFAALTEFEAYGKETVSKNTVATKTTFTPTFGGEHKRAFKTSDFRYDDVKETMDKAIKWFVDTTEAGFKIPDYNGVDMEVKLNDAGWKDAVYYSGLSEAFLTTGDMDEYYFLRAVGNQFKYLNNNGNNTPHGDNYQIGETYLQLNELRGAKYKIAQTKVNADYNIARDMNDKTPPKVTGGEYIDSNRDWSHMGFWWCDALYMAMNTYNLLYELTDNEQYVRQANEGYRFWKNELYNTTYDLWWRDSSQKSLKTGHVDPETNEQFPVFWARGNAWVLAMLAKQMMYLDADTFPEIYEEYKTDYLKLAESILRYQREDGTWNASIVDGEYFGGKETTGTCGYIYGFCVGMELGILDGATYYPAVKKAYECVVNECMYESGQVGYMQTTGYQPQNYKNEDYSKNLTHEFGMGLFLLASSGMMRICSDYEAPAVVIPADPQATLLG